MMTADNSEAPPVFAKKYPKKTHTQLHPYYVLFTDDLARPFSSPSTWQSSTWWAVAGQLTVAMLTP